MCGTLEVGDSGALITTSTDIEQSTEQACDVGEVGERHMRKALALAMIEQRFLGKDEIRFRRYAEVRMSITDQ